MHESRQTDDEDDKPSPAQAAIVGKAACGSAMSRLKLSRPLWLLLAVLVLAAAGLLAWWLRPLSVSTVLATPGVAIDAIYASGAVEPTVVLPVAPRSGGILAELRVDEGAEVRKGEVLARLDDADLANTVKELEAKARYASAQYARAQDLVRRGFVARTELDRGRSELDAANAALRRARAQRGFLALTAPEDGRVIRRDGEIGQFIAPGQAVLVLACCAPLRVTAQVDEEDIARLQPGQPVVLSSDALPGRSFDGQVAEVTPQGDPVARSYRVRIQLTTPEPFQIGMTVDANIIVARHEGALLVPSAAIRDAAVWVLRDGRLHRQPVRTGIAGSERSEILAGLDAGSQVVTGPLEGLSEGRRARAEPAAQEKLPAQALP